MTDTPETTTFEQALAQLEQIVQRLEKGELPLEESLKLYEEGVRLSRLCHGKLEEAEGRIEVLLKDARGEPARDRQGRPIDEAAARAGGRGERPVSGGADAPALDALRAAVESALETCPARLRASGRRRSTAPAATA